MKLTTVTAVASLMVAGAAFASTVAPNEVNMVDGAVAESLTGAAGDPAAGMQVYADKGLGNCVACHQISSLPDVPFQGNVGPALDGVADRWSPEEIRGILVNAKMTYEGTVMPAYYKVDGFIRPGNAYTGKAPEGALEPLLSAQQIEDVVAFLSTLKE